MAKLRVGVVGTGHLGSLHAKVYSVLEKRKKMNIEIKRQLFHIFFGISLVFLLIYDLINSEIIIFQSFLK